MPHISGMGLSPMPPEPPNIGGSGQQLTPVEIHEANQQSANLYLQLAHEGGSALSEICSPTEMTHLGKLVGAMEQAHEEGDLPKMEEASQKFVEFAKSHGIEINPFSMIPEAQPQAMKMTSSDVAEKTAQMQQSFEEAFGAIGGGTADLPILGPGGQENPILGPGGEQKPILGPGGEEKLILGPGGEQQEILASPWGEQGVILEAKDIIGPGGEQNPILGPGGEQKPILGPGGEQNPILGPGGEQNPILGPGGLPPAQP